MMTLEQLCSESHVEKIVGARPIGKWNKSSPTLVRSDGFSREGWFSIHSPKERMILVREFLLDGGSWEALRRFQIPKVGKRGFRNIDVPTVLGQAAQYVLCDWFRDEVEREQGKWSLAYRPGKKFHVNCVRVHRMLQRCPWVQAMDVQDYFGSIRHAKLDSLIDGFNADQRLKDALSSLWRVRVVDHFGKSVASLPGRGIGQGLTLSPYAANLYSAATWARINRQISSRSAAAPYYCDDALPSAPTAEHLASAVRTAQAGLAEIGLSTTVGTLIDTRRQPVEWLGLLFSQDHIDVSERKLTQKVQYWRELVSHDQLSRDGVEDSARGLLAHYAKLLSSARQEEIQVQLRDEMDSIVYPCPSGRKEEMFLQSLRG